MSIVSSTNRNKKKVICHVPTGNQFENIKPIEVKCFLDDQKITIETEQPQTDVTATMMTIVPQRKRPISAATKKQPVIPVTDMVVAKPIRHLAILPSSKEQTMKGNIKHPIDLSETFTMYDGPATTPVMARSLDETVTMNNENEMFGANYEIPVNIDELNLCSDTTISSVCELIDQPKSQPKPHSLIGRYQLPPTDTSAKPSSSPPPPPPSVHIATVHYGETQPAEAANKQVLIQQFYDQLEKMKATFHIDQTEASPQLTTNTLTFDNGQVKQSTATNQLKEKTIIKRVSSATIMPPNTKKPPLQKKQRIIIRKNPSTRIQSAPVKMAAQTPKIRNSNPISSCKSRQCEKIPVQEKQKSLPIKDQSIDPIESEPINQIEFHQSEVTLLPHEEQECRRMFEKLQRLQPNGACADLNTLRRALYPPVGITTYSSNLNQLQTTSSPFKSYRQRTEEMPQSWIKIDDKYVSQYVPKQPPTTSNESNPSIPSDNTNLDRIADQMKKHAAINYSYYTRTK